MLDMSIVTAAGISSPWNSMNLSHSASTPSLSKEFRLITEEDKKNMQTPPKAGSNL